MGDDKARWRALAAAELSGADPDSLIRPTPEGIDVAPLYAAEDLPGGGWPGLPGEAPFTRGVRATMYANRPWTVRQYAGFATAEAVSYTHLTLPTKRIV